MFGVVGALLTLLPVLNVSDTSGTYRGGAWKNTQGKNTGEAHGDQLLPTSLSAAK